MPLCHSVNRKNEHTYVNCTMHTRPMSTSIAQQLRGYERKHLKQYVYYKPNYRTYKSMMMRAFDCASANREISLLSGPISVP